MRTNQKTEMAQLPFLTQFHSPQTDQMAPPAKLPFFYGAECPQSCGYQGTARKDGKAFTTCPAYTKILKKETVRIPSVRWAQCSLRMQTCVLRKDITFRSLALGLSALPLHLDNSQ